MAFADPRMLAAAREDSIVRTSADRTGRTRPRKRRSEAAMRRAWRSGSPASLLNLVFDNRAARRHPGLLRRHGDALRRNERIGVRVRDQVLMRQQQGEQLQLAFQRQWRQQLFARAAWSAAHLLDEDPGTPPLVTADARTAT